MSRIELLPHQYDFVECENKFTLIAGGIGSGKSYAGACWALNMIAKYPKAIGGIFANTYKQLRNATLNTFFNLLEEHNIPYTFNKNESIVTVFGTKIYCYSLDNYDALRGIEIGWGWIDEAAYAHEEAWDVLNGRLRGKNGPLQIKMTTTPKGFNWVYRLFIESQNEYTRYFTASTFDNVYLPKTYADSLTKTYDEKLQAQELHGQFINITQGRIYYSFDRVKNVSDFKQSNLHSYMSGMDFNVNPITATIGQYINGSLYIFDEFWITSSNTNELAEQIKYKYGTIQIAPDSTGKALKTSSAGKSDHDILRSYGHTVLDVRNPFRRDRYNLVNKMLDDGRLIISPKCSKLIKDLEQLSYKEGSDLPDLSNPSLGHISDALGYLCWYCNPYAEQKERLKTQKLF